MFLTAVVAKYHSLVVFRLRGIRLHPCIYVFALRQ